MKDENKMTNFISESPRMERPVSFRISSHTYKKLYDYCAYTGMPKSRVIERAVSDYLRDNFSNVKIIRKPTRSKKDTRVQISLRMHEVIYQNLELHCKNTGSQKTAVIQKAINDYIDIYLAQKSLLNNHTAKIKNLYKKNGYVNEFTLNHLLGHPSDKKME